MRLNVPKQLLSALLPALLVGVTGVCLYLWLRFSAAVEFVNSLNLEVSKVTGATFYADPKRLFSGQHLTRAEIVAHLRAINFTEQGSPQQPGSYLVEGADRLTVFPRLPEFAAVRLAFKGAVLSAITQLQPGPAGQAEETRVEQTTLEPETLGAYQTSGQGQSATNLFVRCYPVQWPELDESHLLYAVMAREDPGFMTHHAISYRSVARAVLSKLAGRSSGGGSTITMQLVKNVVTRNWEKTLARKLDELFYAAALELRLSKHDLFTLYSNSIYMGARGGASLYGLSAAAEEYFGKADLRQLTLNEACVLAVLINQPNVYLEQMGRGAYQPILERRNRVLDTLHAHWPEKYPRALTEQTKQEPVRFTAPTAQPRSALDNLSEEFVTNYAAGQAALRRLKQQLTPAEAGRLHIYTTLNADLMREAERLITTRVPAIERRYPAVNDCDPAPERQQANRMLATLIALDPRSGEIIAMYGGAGGQDGYRFAHAAVQSLSRPASLVKPFWQALAFERHVRLPNGEPLTAASVVDASAYTVNGWRPELGIGGPARLRVLLASSRDDYAAFLVSQLGLPEASDFFQRVSRQSILAARGEVAIGLHPEMEVAPLTMARAYAAFAANGLSREPTPFNGVYLDGRALELTGAQPEALFSPEAAYLTVQMLRSVTGYGADGKHGTLRAAFQQAAIPVNRLEIAGKTGSGPDAVWAVSVSPRLVVVAWLGYQCPPAPVTQEARARAALAARMKAFVAGETAAYLLADFLKAVATQRPDLLQGRFERPANVSAVGIHPQTGCRSDEAGSLIEYFSRGAEPRPCEARP